MVVVKNTLLHKAFEASEVDYEGLYSALTGNTAVLFSEVANTPAKLLKDYTKQGIPALNRRNSGFASFTRNQCESGSRVRYDLG